MMVRYGLRALYYFHSILGLVPYELNNQNGLRRSKCKRQWTLTIGCTTVVLVGFSFCTVWLQDTLSFATFVDALLIRSLVLVEFTIRYGTVVLCFYQLLRHEVSLHRYVQRFVVIGKSVIVRCNSRSYASVQRMVYALVAKMLIADVGLCTLFAMNSGIKRHETSAHVYRTVNIYVVMMSSQFTNLLLLMLLFGSYVYGQINKQLDRTVHRLASFETQQSYWSRRRVRVQQICCDASDTIDRLCTLHQELTEIVRAIVSIFQLPVLLMNLNQFIVIVSRIYFVYILSAQVKHRSDYMSYHRFFNSILYICFEAVQCFLLALGSSVIAQEARRPGTTMNVFVNAWLDTRTERSIELFTLAVLTTDARIKIGGMYVLNMAFVFSLATTVNMYLIVLVQFQLNID
ncbi:AGAP001170-PA [Anopheles gambiae str. PEST]|uniref:Gustatory receptor n=1 Tax=Anopheles gambiae TaxID=7165 RepID=Q7PKH9_ANOGA|nr:AGAP001170-PA [Anopheles gambiae str. PEST]